MNKWVQSVQLLACPRCAQSMHVEKGSVICAGGHCYDISKKGYLNFITGKTSEFYTKELYDNRRKIYQREFYTPVLTAMQRAIDTYAEKKEVLTILDAGCGEGFFLSNVCKERNAVKIGIDITKSAIVSASNQKKDILWMVGDLAKAPIASNCVDVVLSIFSPSNYQMFRRVLRKDGIVVKVIPQKEYLTEFYAVINNQKKRERDDIQVLEHLRKHMNVLALIPIWYQVKVTESDVREWSSMTPMLVGVPISKKMIETIQSITVHVCIIVAKKE